MTQCWPEGALRAYLDRELPPEDIQRVAAHLKDCATCDGLCRELASRAAYVCELVDLLPELESETLHVPLRMTRRPGAVRRVGWVGAAVAMAAGLGIVAYLVPRPQPAILVSAAPPAVRVDAPPPVPAVPAPPTHERAMAVRPAKNAVRPAAKHVLDAGDFVALDDEPFESGLIMRVAVTPGTTQADIVFGPDGRARAFRLVKAPSQKF